MDTPATPQPLPFNIGGRSFADDIRLRWGGLGCVVLGVLASGTGGAPGIFFGLFLVALGVATWTITRLGRIPWHDIPTNTRWIAGAGSIIGNAFFLFFFLTFFLVAWFINTLANNTK